MELPLISQQKVLQVDATPNPNYPVRILKAYRENCDMKWTTTGMNKDSATIWEAMNFHQSKRAKILDRAIAVLEKHIENISENFVLKQIDCPKCVKITPQERIDYGKCPVCCNKGFIEFYE